MKGQVCRIVRYMLIFSFIFQSSFFFSHYFVCLFSRIVNNNHLMQYTRIKEHIVRKHIKFLKLLNKVKIV